MPLVHNLFVGHFIPEHGYVRFEDHNPVVTRPINRAAAIRLLRNDLGGGATPDEIPEAWGVSLPDWIVCDAQAAPPAALRFVADYAQQEKATILDLGSFALLTPEQVRQCVATPPQSLPA